MNPPSTDTTKPKEKQGKISFRTMAEIQANEANATDTPFEQVTKHTLWRFNITFNVKTKINGPYDGEHQENALKVFQVFTVGK